MSGILFILVDAQSTNDTLQYACIQFWKWFLTKTIVMNLMKGFDNDLGNVLHSTLRSRIQTYVEKKACHELYIF